MITSWQSILSAQLPSPIETKNTTCIGCLSSLAPIMSQFGIAARAGFGFGYAELDDTDQELIRLGFYTITHGLYSLYRRSDMLIIGLDLSSPQDFILQLREIFSTINFTSTDGEIARNEEYLHRQTLHPAAPLTAGSLVVNIGIPVILVVTNVLSANQAQEEHIKQDFIQQSLRSVALQYGASVLYLSTEPLTQEYLLHRLFQVPLVREPNVLGLNVWVPAGWDTLGKIRMLNPLFPIFDCFDWQVLIGLYEEELGLEKNVFVFDEITSVLVVAEDEQKFLLRHVNEAAALEIEPKPETKEVPKAVTTETLSGKLARLRKEKVAPKKLDTLKNTSPKPVVQNELLANFFQSLKTKKK